MLDVIIILLVFGLVIRSNTRIGRMNPGLPSLESELNGLFFYHILFIGVFTWYITTYGGDSMSYWSLASFQTNISSDRWFDYFGVNTEFMQFVCFVPSKVMGLSYICGNFLFGVIGYAGLRYLLMLCYEIFPRSLEFKGVRVLPFLFYLPNLNFWIAGVGKDTLAFFSIACFLYGIRHFGKRIPAIILSLTLAFFVRPHVAVLIGIGTGMAVLLSGRIKLGYKILFSLLILGAFALTYDRLLGFLRISDLNKNTLEDMAHMSRVNLATKEVGSKVNLESYSIPMRIFTFLYRPLFFDARDMLGLISSLENAFYVVLTIAGLRSASRRNLTDMPLWLKAGLGIFVFSVIVFSNTLSNLGIAVRMKNMTMIYFLIVLIYFLSRGKKNELHNP